MAVFRALAGNTALAWVVRLLRAIPRTATVTASADVTVYELSREPFLAAVLGHAATERQAIRAAGELPSGDALAAGRAAGLPGASAS
jgi:CRP-like cAMP-binding protein